MSKRVNNHKGKRPPQPQVRWSVRLQARAKRDRMRAARIAQRRKAGLIIVDEVSIAKPSWFGLGGDHG